MKKESSFSLILFIFIITSSMVIHSTGYAISSNNQGLSWGMTIGSQFNYSINFESTRNYPYSLEEEIYVEVVDIPTLPDIVSDVRNFSWVDPDNYRIYFSNGTSWEETPGLFSIYWHPVPIGNWTLMKDLFSSAMEPSSGLTWIDTENRWGFTVTNTETDSVLDYYTEEYSKINGILNHFLAEYQSGGETQIHTEITREGYIPLSDSQELLIYIGVGAAITILVAAVIVIRRRR
jgi:hypothetical protein